MCIRSVKDNIFLPLLEIRIIIFYSYILPESSSCTPRNITRSLYWFRKATCVPNMCADEWYLFLLRGPLLFCMRFFSPRSLSRISP